MIKITGQKYQDVINVIFQEESEFNSAGGPNATVSMGTAKKVARRFGMSLEERDDKLVIYQNNDGGQSVYVGHDLPPDKSVVSKEQIALTEFNEFEAVAVNPLRVRAEANQVELSADVILKVLEKDRINKKRKILKTVLNDSLIHDFNYLRSLYKNHGFLVAPMNLSRKIREKLQPMFLHIYITDAFTNKLIAFNDNEILYSFIVNV
jgi:hypothetical protein